MVNGVVHAPLGYRIVGEVVPWDFMAAEVTAACQAAVMTDLEDSEVAVVSRTNTRDHLGSKSLKRIMRVVYRTVEAYRAHLVSNDSNSDRIIPTFPGVTNYVRYPMRFPPYAATAGKYWSATMSQHQ